jgi:L-alanine-DL-glutamate epimerase-like enolase superfamily enzyme
MRIAEYRITRFQFARDRVIGDSQVRADAVNVAALELITDDGRVGLGFVQAVNPNSDAMRIMISAWRLAMER